MYTVSIAFPGNDDSLDCIAFYGEIVANYILQRKLQIIKMWSLNIRGMENKLFTPERTKRLINFDKTYIDYYARENFEVIGLAEFIPNISMNTDYSIDNFFWTKLYQNLYVFRIHNKYSGKNYRSYYMSKYFDKVCWLENYWTKYIRNPDKRKIFFKRRKLTSHVHFFKHTNTLFGMFLDKFIISKFLLYKNFDIYNIKNNNLYFYKLLFFLGLMRENFSVVRSLDYPPNIKLEDINVQVEENDVNVLYSNKTSKLLDQKVFDESLDQDDFDEKFVKGWKFSHLRRLWIRKKNIIYRKKILTQLKFLSKVDKNFIAIQKDLRLNYLERLASILLTNNTMINKIIFLNRLINGDISQQLMYIYKMRVSYYLIQDYKYEIIETALNVVFNHIVSIKLGINIKKLFSQRLLITNKILPYNLSLNLLMRKYLYILFYKRGRKINKFNYDKYYILKKNENWLKVGTPRDFIEFYTIKGFVDVNKKDLNNLLW